jgi:hypothetical protein
VCPRFKDARRWLRRHALAPHAPDAHADADFVDAESLEAAAGAGAPDDEHDLDC